MWTGILSLIYKEFLAILRDKQNRIVLIIPPVVQLLIFAYSATLDVRNVPIGILNRDNGAEAFELVQRFHGSPVFNKIVHLHAVEEIKPFIDNLKGVMVVSIDEQFSRNLGARKPADIQLILDGRKSNTTQIVAGYATAIVQQYNKDFTSQARIKQQNTELITRFWFNPNLLYHWYNIPCLSGIITMLVSVMLTALSIARERELGTFDQLLVSPLTPFGILLGKTIPAIIISVMEGTLITLVGVHVFQVPFVGSVWLFYLNMFVFVCSIVGVGLFISTFANTQQQAILGSFLFLSPSIILSGFATPVENMPGWLQVVSHFIPLRYYLINAKGIFLKDIPADIVFSNLWPMALIALFTMTGVTLLFRRRLG